jgi:hypothetical protein
MFPWKRLAQRWEPVMAQKECKAKPNLPGVLFPLSTLLLVGVAFSVIALGAAPISATGTSGGWQPGDLAPLTRYSLEPLIWGVNYATWYQESTGYVPDADFYGAYAIEPVTNTLYLGFGTALPAARDGALLASYDGRALAAIATLNEQGIMDMTTVGGTLYVPGVDACCPDGWAWGNTYVYQPPGPVAKYRNLPGVIHSWGLWFNGEDDALYAAASSFSRNPRGWSGNVFRSTDQAKTWVRLADRDDGVGQYRTYDVIGFQQKLYVTWNDALEKPCGLAESSDGGETWTRLLVHQTDCGARLMVLGDRLLALKSDRSGFVAVDASGSATAYDFPGFRVPDRAYDYLTHDNRGYRYTITDDGRVVRSSDLITWETLASTDLAFITISYWPAKKWIIVADRGASARLWRIDLSKKRFHHIP